MRTALLILLAALVSETAHGNAVKVEIEIPSSAPFGVPLWGFLSMSNGTAEAIQIPTFRFDQIQVTTESGDVLEYRGSYVDAPGGTLDLVPAHGIVTHLIELSGLVSFPSAGRFHVRYVGPHRAAAAPPIPGPRIESGLTTEASIDLSESADSGIQFLFARRQNQEGFWDLVITHSTELIDEHPSSVLRPFAEAARIKRLLARIDEPALANEKRFALADQRLRRLARDYRDWKPLPVVLAQAAEKAFRVEQREFIRSWLDLIRKAPPTVIRDAALRYMDCVRAANAR